MIISLIFINVRVHLDEKIILVLGIVSKPSKWVNIALILELDFIQHLMRNKQLSGQNHKQIVVAVENEQLLLMNLMIVK
jgi:hypothetical protein